MSGPVLVAIAGLLGLAVGSFLNVCIHRLPRGESLARPPSHCPSCGTPIRWYHNVPVLGFLWLRGRCRRCGAAISLQYPLVEVATAALFVAHAVQTGGSIALAPRLIFTAAMVVLFVIDLQHRILPNVITLPGIVLGVASSLVLPPGVRDSVLGVVLGGGVLLAISEVYLRMRGEEGLGMGDVKMLAMIGAFLGWKLMLVTLVLSSLAGSVVGVWILLLRRGSLKYALPFGTFLAVGAVWASLFGQPLLDWYLGFYR